LFMKVLCASQNSGRPDTADCHNFSQGNVYRCSEQPQGVATTQPKPHSSPEENLASSKNQRRSHREMKS